MNYATTENFASINETQQNYFQLPINHVEVIMLATENSPPPTIN